MEFESKVIERVQENTHIEPVNDAQGSTLDDDTLQGNSTVLPPGE